MLPLCCHLNNLNKILVNEILISMQIFSCQPHPPIFSECCQVKGKERVESFLSIQNFIGILRLQCCQIPIDYLKRNIV